MALAGYGGFRQAERSHRNRSSRPGLGLVSFPGPGPYDQRKGHIFMPGMRQGIGRALDDGATPSASDRRRDLRTRFDAQIRKEWDRYASDRRLILSRTLRERFLLRHLKGRSGTILELGPGPGRFTPILARSARNRFIAVDLSKSGLQAARQRLGRTRPSVRGLWVQAAGEQLPMRNGSIDHAVVLGNVVNFAARDGDLLLRELARVLRRGVSSWRTWPLPPARCRSSSVRRPSRGS
jgi:SAM-dependent methyltransferase